ncbi:transcriptional regulator [Photorhabdus asymbiotica]|uniref:Transcriptional regulator n=2 Tax=Photorhabdus asymbiotica TaxID=291112 RepID=C7BK64_PHOAA|nr:hypothetical protein BDD30_0080 [Photorhabdus asymbiotica]CAQ84304.1 transcriptional regulator [Photorhabdus asymbiotica]
MSNPYTKHNIADNEFSFHLFTYNGGQKVRTLDEVIAARSPESQERIKELADEMILETGLQMMREELQLSQKYVADVMGKPAS